MRAANTTHSRGCLDIHDRPRCVLVEIWPFAMIIDADLPG
jgi:hypothetical protein